MAPEGPYGDVIIVLAYTGLRWGELRALRARDVVIDDDGIATALRVRRSASDGFPEKAPKSGKVRKVPLMQRPALIISRRLRGLKPDDIEAYSWGVGEYESEDGCDGFWEGL